MYKRNIFFSGREKFFCGEFLLGNFIFHFLGLFVLTLQIAAKLDRVVVLQMLHTWDFVGPHPQVQQFYYCICSLFWPR